MIGGMIGVFGFDDVSDDGPVGLWSWDAIDCKREAAMAMWWAGPDEFEVLICKVEGFPAWVPQGQEEGWIPGYASLAAN